MGNTARLIRRGLLAVFRRAQITRKSAEKGAQILRFSQIGA